MSCVLLLVLPSTSARWRWSGLELSRTCVQAIHKLKRVTWWLSTISSKRYLLYFSCSVSLLLIGKNGHIIPLKFTSKNRLNFSIKVFQNCVREMLCRLPDEFSGGPVLHAATRMLVGIAERACPGWLCGTFSCFFFFLPIKPLFKYSFVVGLLLLLQCLNGSVHPFKKGELGGTLPVCCSDQSSPRKITLTSICIYSVQLFQRNLKTFFAKSVYSYQICMVLSLKISR